MKQPTPTNAFIENIFNLRCHLAGCVAVIAEQGPAPKEAVIGLVSRMHEHDAAVQGNRPEHAPMTWKDLAYTLAHSLRLLADHLEER